MSVDVLEKVETVRIIERISQTMLDDLNLLNIILERILHDNGEVCYADLVDAKVLEMLMNKFSHYLNGTSIGE
jgi:hypothetical protein